MATRLYTNGRHVESLDWTKRMPRGNFINIKWVSARRYLFNVCGIVELLGFEVCFIIIIIINICPKFLLYNTNNIIIIYYLLMLI